MAFVGKRRLPFVAITTITAAGMTAAYAYHQRNKALPLSPDYFTPLTLVKATKLTSTIREFTFHSDASSPHVLNPLIPSAYWVKHDGIQVARPYTPIKVTSKDGKDELTFAIRVYPDGTMSRWLWTKTSGDVVEWRGPIPSADWTFDPKRDTSLLLIAGGTGITPMWQIIQNALKSDYKGRIRLIYANRSDEDILLKDELDALSKSYSDHLNITYVCEHVSTEWKCLHGRVTHDLLQSTVEHNSTPIRPFVVVCGPNGCVSYLLMVLDTFSMMREICGEKPIEQVQGPVTGYLGQLGYDNTNVIKL